MAFYGIANSRATSVENDLHSECIQPRFIGDIHLHQRNPHKAFLSHRSSIINSEKSKPPKTSETTFVQSKVFFFFTKKNNKKNKIFTYIYKHIAQHLSENFVRTQDKMNQPIFGFV